MVEEIEAVGAIEEAAVTAAIADLVAVDATEAGLQSRASRDR
ncbi:MAG TPA: hypothetical protein VFF43_04760 [Caldimonas sp.]|nr:hypothetical protein [Caldimonas sp.]